MRIEQVTELCELLRRNDTETRRRALELLAGWQMASVGAHLAPAILGAATVAYPQVPGVPGHPDELWVRLLWPVSAQVDVHDVLVAYALGGDRVRRSLLHLLALRADSEAIEALEELLGDPDRAEQLPTPNYVSLAPIVAHPDAVRLVPTLARLVVRPGWSWEAADALRQFELDGRLGHRERRQVVAGVVPVSRTLVDSCDRSSAADPDRVDPARVDRERLQVIASLLTVLPGDEVTSALYRMLSSADPRVAAYGAVALLARGERVAPERLELIVRDPVARVELHEGLLAEGALGDVPALFDDDVSLAEAFLVRWLSSPSELGTHPDEIEYLGPHTVISDAGPADLHVFRFRMRAPHWSSARDWMIGAASDWAYSCYMAEDECSIDDHVANLLDSVATWDAD